MGNKIFFGVKNPKAYSVPDFSNLVRTTKNESIFLFGASVDNQDKTLCAGIGRVVYVNHGEKMDIVGINFGRKYARQIIAVDNHARRQIYGLKKTQLCWFYGYYKVYNDGKNPPKSYFFAKGFLPWYVPKMLDIKNYDLDSITQLEQEQETTMINFLDDLLKGS